MATEYRIEFASDDAHLHINRVGLHGDIYQEADTWTVTDDRDAPFFESILDGADIVTEWEAVEYGQTNIKTITLSDAEPHTTSAGPSGTAWQSGDEATIFYDADSKSYGYCFHGIGSTGLGYEADDVLYFNSADEAEQAAREAYEANAHDLEREEEIEAMIAEREEKEWSERYA